jgi:hypothetical protein
MELVDYRITEGSEYHWRCYGPNAYTLDSWNQDHDGYSIGIIFDLKTHIVYEVTACDYERDRAYRLINPDYLQAYRNESRERDVEEKQAWDDVNYVDLEEEDDFLRKAEAIRDKVDYDTRVSVPLDVPDDVLFELMKNAHEKDITLNNLIENILKDAIDRDEFSRRNIDDIDRII